MQNQIQELLDNQVYGAVIYLLHYPRKLKRARHYLGICHLHRFETRMLEHARGHGSNFTRAISAINHEFRVVRVWTYATAELEKKLKRSGHHDLKCPVCRGDCDLSNFPSYNTWITSKLTKEQRSFAELTSFQMHDTGWETPDQ